MAGRQVSAAAVLLVVAVALAGFGVDAQVVPIANCWKTTNTGDATITRLFFGYNNPFAVTQNITASNTNTYTSPPDVNQQPQQVFYPGEHGLSSFALLTPDISLNRTWALTWILGNLAVTIDDGAAVQECKSTDAISFQLLIPDATVNNETLIVDVLVENLGVEAARFTFDAASNMTFRSISIQPPSAQSTTPTSQFELMLTLYDTFFNGQQGLSAQLGAAAGGNVANLVGGKTSTDVIGAPIAVPVAPPQTVVTPQAVAPNPLNNVIYPVAHCWEPDTNTSDNHALLYFGYISSYSTAVNIDPNTPANQFLGLSSSTASYVPVFYPGINGFVVRVRAVYGSLVQWNLNGYSVLLNTQDADFACQENTNQLGLVSVAAFPSGTYNATTAPLGINAMSDVTRLPISNVQGDYTNVVGGGFRAEFNLTSPSVAFESVYTAMWRSVNDFHLASSVLNTQWNEIFGEYASNYSSAGTANDVIGSQLPPSSTMHVPVAHCWAPGPSIDQPIKIAYFGYLSNYPKSLSYLQGPNNFIVNSEGYTAPQVLYSGYNGFAVAVTLAGDAIDNTNVAWNLAGNTVQLDLTNTSQRCAARFPLQLTIAFSGTLLSNIDQTKAANNISAYISQQTGHADVLVQFDPTVDGFIATATVTPVRDNNQYDTVSSFVQRCNSFNAYSVRATLSGFANATAGICQGGATSMDRLGSTGSTVETHNFGNGSLTITPTCWAQDQDLIYGYFGYSSNSPLSISAASTFTSGSGSIVSGRAPSVFTGATTAPYAAKIVASGTAQVTWHVLGQTVTVQGGFGAPSECNGGIGAGVRLAFERRLQNPPPSEPVVSFIADATGYPYDHLLISWDYDSTSDFIATVNFVPLNIPTTVFNPSKRELFVSPVSAVFSLVDQLTNNFNTSAGLSAAAEAHLYSALSVTYNAPPYSAPVTPPSNPRKGLTGAVVFAIVVGVLLGVGIIGGILFYFFKHHKGMCRGDVEHRPLLADH